MEYIELTGYKLDEYHMIAELFNNDGTSAGYYMFTFHNKYETEALKSDENGKLFDMEQIDINNFEWNGRKVRAEIA